MKKQLLSALILVIAITSASAQERPSSAANANTAYCELTTMKKAMTDKVTISISYGDNKPDWITDQSATVEAFIRLPDALNHLAESGWNLVTALSLPSSSGFDKSQYILKIVRQ